MGKNRKYILSARAIKIGIEQDRDRDSATRSQRVKANKNKYATKKETKENALSKINKN